MNKKRDLRVQKTYNALFSAFQSLLKEKSFDDITVKELCDLALVRTATFYKHFSDKYSFFSFMVDELRTEYYASISLPSSSTEDFYLSLIKTAFSFLQEHETLIHAIDSDSMMNIITKTTGNSLRNELIKHLIEDEKKGCNLVATPELTAELFIGSMNQLSRLWLASSNKKSPEEISLKLKEYVRRMIGN